MSNELILIIEDDEKSRKLVRDVLGLKGYRTVETDNAEEGIRLAQQQHPALILMDIHLPGMNGIEALQSLRRDNERLRSECDTLKSQISLTSGDSRKTQRILAEHDLLKRNQEQAVVRVERALQKLNTLRLQ